MIIPILADILNSTEKEKVKRIILATFKVKLLKWKSINWIQMSSIAKINFIPI